MTHAELDWKFDHYVRTPWEGVDGLVDAARYTAVLNGRRVNLFTCAESDTADLYILTGGFALRKDRTSFEKPETEEALFRLASEKARELFEAHFA